MIRLNNNLQAHDFLKTNLARAVGYNQHRTWLPFSKIEKKSIPSFLSSFFICSEWNNWMKAVGACLNGRLTEKFISHETETKMLDLNHRLNACFEIAHQAQRQEIKPTNNPDLFADYKGKNHLSTSCYQITQEGPEIEAIRFIGTLWHRIASSYLEQSDEGIFMDALGVAGELHIFPHSPGNLIDTFSNKNYGVITCAYRERIYGIAMLEPCQAFPGSIYLSILATDPRNIKSITHATRSFPQIRGVGSLLIYEIFQKCLKERKGLTFIPHGSTRPFFKKLGMIDENEPKHYLGYIVIKLEKIRKLIKKFPLPNSPTDQR